jgi:hypothetical protein
MADIQMLLSDRSVSQLPLADAGQYMARDEKLKGFYVLVGRRSRRYMVKGDLRHDGKRAATIKVSVGDAAEISASKARTIATGYLSEIRQGRHPKPDDVRPASVVAEAVAETSTSGEQSSQGPTLREAWQAYKAALIKKERAPKTIRDYEDHVGRHFKRWADEPIKALADDPGKVSRRHDAITTKSGPYAANGAMRTLRAIYNHAWKNNKKVLPRDNPVDTVDWNKEHRRNTAMGVKDLPAWFGELVGVENPLRREFHLLTLLSASRPGALKAAKPEHLDLQRRVLLIPAPKGGEDRAFDIPLSRQMICSLMRVIRFGRFLHPLESRTWLFPAFSKSGHLSETKEDRADLAKWGNDLRQTFRTMATVAKVPSVDAKLLMNHAIPGVNEGYITRDKILEDHLRAQQQAISDVVFGAIAADTAKPGRLRDWFGPRSTREAIEMAIAEGAKQKAA